MMNEIMYIVSLDFLIFFFDFLVFCETKGDERKGLDSASCQECDYLSSLAHSSSFASETFLCHPLGTIAAAELVTLDATGPD